MLKHNAVYEILLSTISPIILIPAWYMLYPEICLKVYDIVQLIAHSVTHIRQRK